MFKKETLAYIETCYGIQKGIRLFIINCQGHFFGKVVWQVLGVWVEDRWCYGSGP